MILETMNEAYPMRTMLAACALAVTFVVPALADDAPKKGSDADEAFMTGVRKLGVMAGQAHACSKEGDQPKVGQSAIDLATQVSLHFGLQAAFVFSGSFGYGMGHEFDRKTCPQALEDFKALQAKYLRGCDDHTVHTVDCDHVGVRGQHVGGTGHFIRAGQRIASDRHNCPVRRIRRDPGAAARAWRRWRWSAGFWGWQSWWRSAGSRRRRPRRQLQQQ